MIIKIKINAKRSPIKKNQIVAWIQRNKEIESDIKQLFQFFKNQMKVSKKRRILPYYRISSETPAILLSFFSALQEILPEAYFNEADSVEFEESFNS